MTDPDTIITTMAQQREQERAQDEAHYMLRKACQARAVDLYNALARAHGVILGMRGQDILKVSADLGVIDQLLKEIDDATQ